MRSGPQPLGIFKSEIEYLVDWLVSDDVVLDSEFDVVFDSVSDTTLLSAEDDVLVDSAEDSPSEPLLQAVNDIAIIAAIISASDFFIK